MAREAFGDGMVPQLQSAVYKVPKTHLHFIWNFCFVMWISKKKETSILCFFSCYCFYLCTSWRQNSETTPTRPWQNVKNPSDVLSSLQAPTSWSHSDTARLQVARICSSMTQKNMFSSILVNYFWSENYGQFLKWPQGDSTTKRTFWNWNNNVNHYITLSFYSLNQHFNPVVLKITLLLLLFLYITGISSTPVTPLLSSILLKGRNNFVITDNSPAPSSQTHQQNWSWQTLQWSSSLWPLLTSSPHLMYFWHFYRHSPWFSSHGFWCVPTTNSYSEQTKC